MVICYTYMQCITTVHTCNLHDCSVSLPQYKGQTIKHFVCVFYGVLHVCHIGNCMYGWISSVCSHNYYAYRTWYFLDASTQGYKFGLSGLTAHK